MNSAARNMDLEHILPPDAFSRSDETNDRLFYQRDRFVSHLDAVALATVESLIGQLVVEEHPVILDLMASWDSHIPESVRPAQVVGLGLNENELAQNERLSRWVLHDLNANPKLPFQDGMFDVVLNTVSVDYMTRPIEAFREVGRVLKPGGLYLVIFSNRMFPPKAVKIWRESGEQERMLLVLDYFKESGAFENPQTFISQGKPRPKDDKYAHTGLPSDPVYAVYAEKKGRPTGCKERPSPTTQQPVPMPSPDELERRKKEVGQTLRCPYCSVKMRKWAVPQSPFTEWDNEFMYVCFNDECPYLIQGWDFMNQQGNFGMSYRLMYNPERDSLMPIPIPSLQALKESIVD